MARRAGTADIRPGTGDIIRVLQRAGLPEQFEVAAIRADDEQHRAEVVERAAIGLPNIPDGVSFNGGQVAPPDAEVIELECTGFLIRKRAGLPNDGGEL